MPGFFAKSSDETSRYSDKSLISARNRDHDRRWGPLKPKGAYWHPEEIAALLELFLVEELPLIGNNSLVSRLRRGYKCIETFIQKVAIKHPNMCPYLDRITTCGRTKRKGSFTDQDLYIIGLATGEGSKKKAGIKYGALDDGFEYIARVLGRSVPDTRKRIYDLIDRAVRERSDLNGFNVEGKAHPRDMAEKKRILGKSLVKGMKEFHLKKMSI